MDQQYRPGKNEVAEFFELMKKLAKLHVSFYVFSFFVVVNFAFFSWISFCLNYSLSHLSSFRSTFLSHVYDKSFIFLLCNGILVFLGKFSGRMIGSSQQPQIDLEDEFFEKNVKSLQQPDPFSSSPEGLEKVGEDEDEEESTCNLVRERETADEANEEEDNEGLKGEKDERKEEKEIASHDESEEKEDSESGFSEDEEDEKIGIAGMSTEHLNKKFEDFIRKMKEEFRREAQGQLIYV
ncbi:hypothetical protein Nepgr_027339 [Nepenthes gracilis]|uniref:Uncharacterized protein n=1 Tax=Nepenthes gracilis TaxID=150966 RepID=A0AAD3TAC2_NEPGR|nr:hypothetical protein Nepgr_027339 [Nepenthes gracilis]